MPQLPPEPTLPDPLRVLTLVRELDERFGAQLFGQQMQNLLALAFLRAGFTVVRNTVGVPDLQVFGPTNPVGFAVESKTGDTAITLSRRDLEGVKSTNRAPVVASFFLSAPVPRWLLTDARALRPATYRRYDLEPKPSVDVGFDVTAMFSRVLVDSYQVAIEGPAALARLLGS